MIFNIPEWPSDSDIKHTATTWVLSKDVDGEDVEEQIDESEDFLISWENNTLIPTGEIWYLKALRKLEDEDGNVIANDKWIGPKPVFNEESNVNDYLAPKYYIKTPYISDLTFTPGESLVLKVTPFESNIAYENTIVTIEDGLGKLLYSGFYDINVLDHNITITNENLDFNEVTDIKITIFYIGKHSTVSNPYVEEVNLRKIFYKTISTTKQLDPKSENVISIRPTGSIGVNVESASLLNLQNDIIINTLTVTDDDDIILPPLLEYGNSYKLALYISYNDTTGAKQFVNDVFILTTMGQDEKQPINENIQYRYIVEKLNTIELDSADDVISSDIDYNTEEFFTHLIPVPNKSDSMDMEIYDRQYKIFRPKDTDILSLNENHSIRLITRDTGIIQRNVDDVLTFDIFTYDAYRDTITVTNTITTGLRVANAANWKIVEINDGVYVIGIDIDDDKLIKVQELDITTGELTDKASYVTLNSLTDITVCGYKTNEALIVPQGDGEFRTLVYSVNDDYVTKSLAMPAAFKNIPTLATRLNNGNSIVFKYNGEDKPLDYFYVDTIKESLISKELLYNGAGKITNLIKLKNGNILFLFNLEDSKELWRFN